MFTEEELNKLPKWANRKVSALERENERFKKELNEIYGRSPTNVMVGTILNPIPAPNNSDVTFKLGEKDWEYIECRITENNELSIFTNSKMFIKPRATNMAIITFKRD